MIIEFVGAPGAGKSTLTLVTREILRDFGVKAMLKDEAGVSCFKRTPLGRMICFLVHVRSQKRMMWGVVRRLLFLYRLKFAAKNRLLTRQVIHLLAHRQLPKKDKLKIASYFFRDASHYEFFRGRLRPGEALILSEGLVHRATSLYTSAFDEPNALEILHYVNLLPKADLVICVQASLGLCVGRVVSKGGHRRYLGKQLSPFVANSHKTVELAVQGIKDMGWNTIEINNDADIDACASALRNVLEKIKESGFENGNEFPQYVKEERFVGKG